MRRRGRLKPGIVAFTVFNVWIRGVAGPLDDGTIPTAEISGSWQAPMQSAPRFPPNAAVAAGSAGRTHVTGSAGTAVFDSNGVPVWSSVDAGASVIAGSAGDTTIAGPAGTIRYSPSGAVVWKDVVPSLQVIRGSGGRLYVLADAYLMELGDDGVLHWSTVFPPVNGRVPHGMKLSLQSATNVVVCARSEDQRSLHVLGFRSNGDLSWVTTLDTPETVTVKSTQLQAGLPGIWVSVQGASDYGDAFGMVARLGARGGQVWRKEGVGGALAADVLGNVWVGTHDGVLRYDLTGQPSWSAPLSWGALWGDLQPQALAVDGSGNCYVAGAEPSLAKLSTSGCLYWVWRGTNETGATAAASAVAFGTDGTVGGAWAYSSGVTTVAGLRSVDLAGRPKFTSLPQPAFQYAAMSNTVSYTTSASGAAELRYQWSALSAWDLLIEGATNSSFQLDTARSGSEAHAVIVWNDLGYAVSPPVRFKTGFVPWGGITTAIGAQSPLRSWHLPAPQSLLAPVLGSTTVLLSPGASYPPLAGVWDTETFQWSRGSQPIGGATNDALMLPAVEAVDAGTYRLAIENAFGAHQPQAEVVVSKRARQEWLLPVIESSAQLLRENSGRAIVADESGAFYLQNAELEGSPGQYVWVVSRFDPIGARLWTQRLSGYSSGAAHLIAVKGGGNLVAAGVLESGEQKTCVVREYEPAGTLRWEASYTDPAGGRLSVKELRVDGLGGTCLRLGREGVNDGITQVVLRYDAAGQFSHAWRGAMGAEDTSELLATDAQGNVVFATGTSLVKLDMHGTPVWELPNRLTVCVRTSAEGSVYVYDKWAWSGTIQKLTPAGAVAWSREGYGYLELDPTGDVLVRRESRWIGKLDGASGAWLWQYYLGFGDLEDITRQVAVNARGQVYLLGQGLNGSWVAKLDGDGSLLWSADYGLGEAQEFVPNELCRQTAGGVYVLGRLGTNDYAGQAVLRYSEPAVDPGPVVTQAPVDVTVGIGRTVTLQAQAQGTGPLRYQWWTRATGFPPWGGWPVEGATNATCEVAADWALDGNYFVEVWNSDGVTASRPARLTVMPVIESAESLPDGRFRLAVSCPAGRLLGIHESPDLVQWTYVTNLLSSSTTLVLTNLVDPGVPSRYFRVSTLPQ